LNACNRVLNHNENVIWNLFVPLWLFPLDLSIFLVELFAVRGDFYSRNEVWCFAVSTRARPPFLCPILVRVANQSRCPVLVSSVALSPHGLQRRMRSLSLRWSWAVECLVSGSTFSSPAACVSSRLRRRRAACLGVNPLQFAVKA
jgi:hypothetical protein